MHQQLLATYIILEAELDVILCYPNGTDGDVFYDIYYAGQWVNPDEPWYYERKGIPTKEEIWEKYFMEWHGKMYTDNREH